MTCPIKWWHFAKDSEVEVRHVRAPGMMDFRRGSILFMDAIDRISYDAITDIVGIKYSETIPGDEVATFIARRYKCNNRGCPDRVPQTCYVRCYTCGQPMSECL